MENNVTLYLLLADLVLLLHFLFVVFVILGGLLLLKWKRLLWLHLPALAWGIYIEFSGSICPLTPLEIWFRRQAGADPYEGGFISHYLVPLVYPRGLDTSSQWLLGALLIAINLLIYGWLLLYRRKQHKS